MPKSSRISILSLNILHLGFMDNRMCFIHARWRISPEMILNALTKVFGSKNERDLKRLQPRVELINALEPEIQAISDVQL